MTNRTLIWISVAFAAGLVSMVGQTADASARAARRIRQFGDIFDQLQARTDDDFKRYTPEFRERMTGELIAVITQQTLDALEQHGPDPVAVRGHLRSLEATLEPDEETKSPYVFIPGFPGKSTVVTGYLVRRGSIAVRDYKSVIAGYSRTVVGWRLEAQADTDLDQHGLFMLEMPRRQADEACYLAHGRLAGHNGSRTRMRIYCSDGGRFATAWSPPDRLDVKVTVNGAKIIVVSLDEERYYRIPMAPYMRIEEYAFTTEGMVLLASYLVNE